MMTGWKHGIAPLMAAIFMAVVVPAMLAAPQSAEAAHARPGGQAQGNAELDQAYALERGGQLEEAAAAFLRVLERDPENRAARLELGYVSARLGRWEEAARYLGSVSRQEAENLRLRLDYGYALERLGKLEQAAEEFQAVAQRPGEFQEQARGALEAVHAQQAAAASQQKTARTARRDAFLNRGYAQLRAGDRAAARQEFENALAEDPTNATILKQLGYLALEQGNLSQAAERFEAAREQAPQDYPLALQLGYVYERLNRPLQAEEAFRAAQASADPATLKQASAAARNIVDTRLRRFYLDVYAAPLYASRFSDGIAQFQAQFHWRPWLDGPVSFYLGTRVTRDSQSRGGALPAVFSDNVALFGAGVSFQPRNWHMNLYAEANLATNLIETPEHRRQVEPDYRVVLGYYRRWDGKLYGPIGALTMGRLNSDRLFSDVDASAGYYSRYRDNGIAYLQLREGLRLADIGPSRLAAYATIHLSKDTNRDFFNNVGETGVGLEFRPRRDFNGSLRAEYLRGIYYGIEGRDRNPFPAQYNDFRVVFLFGHRF